MIMNSTFAHASTELWQSIGSAIQVPAAARHDDAPPTTARRPGRRCAGARHGTAAPRERATSHAGSAARHGARGGRRKPDVRVWAVSALRVAPGVTPGSGSRAGTLDVTILNCV
jgi:hypothetical protein